MSIAYESNVPTDVIFQEFKLYIEGVQVPFINININNAYGQLPTAGIVLPPQAMLMDITKNYEPKVHIFYYDRTSKADCLLFAGKLVAVSYSKDTESGNVSIQFQCTHKYEELHNITLDYSGYASPASSSMTDAGLTNSANSGGVVKMNMFGQAKSIGLALQGVSYTGTSTEAVTRTNVTANTHKITNIPDSLSSYGDRLKGLAGVSLNLWNQIKEASYTSDPISEAAEYQYIPLVETGFAFFERLSGHYRIENDLNEDKMQPCSLKGNDNRAEKILVPPVARSFMKSAMQADMSWQLARQALEYSGETTSFLTVLDNFYKSFDYELQILSAPAKPDSALTAIDVVVKPQLPFYYAPKCNYVTANLIFEINVTQEDGTTPTRVTVSQTDAPMEGTGFDRHFRAPHSIRAAIANMVPKYANGTQPSTTPANDLRATTGSSYNVVGLYEQARGIRHQRLKMPNWLAYLNVSACNQEGSALKPEAGSTAATYMANLAEAWKARYNGDETAANRLNPWLITSEDNSNLPSHERILFGAADYMYSRAVAATRQGSCTMVFNPYIVPGYPMDIIDPSPIMPCFHAFCVSVSHSISAGGISTSVSFVSAMTYSEMATYYMQFVHPWLQMTLGVTSKVSVTSSTGVTSEQWTSSIVNNPSAKLIADDFYKSVLGVDSVAPEQLYNFSIGRPRKVGSSSAENTTTGALNLVHRPIETKKNLEDKYGLKFIDMAPGNYNSTVVQVTPKVMDITTLLEPGVSPFLNYSPKFNGAA